MSCARRRPGVGLARRWLARRRSKVALEVDRRAALYYRTENLGSEQVSHVASPANIPPELAEIRRAAFDLRQSDPAEAVRVLRRLLRGKGEATPLAHAALAEILLEEFDDIDAALHHFRRFTELAPEIAAGQHGLGRALARAGDVEGARQAFAAAARGLAAAIREAQTAPDHAGIEEAVIGLLDAALDDRELQREHGGSSDPLQIPADLFSWAEAARVFDAEDEDAGDLEDWSRYVNARSEYLAQAEGLEASLAFVSRLSDLVPLPPATRHRVLWGLHERHGDLAVAASEALAAIDAEPGGIDPEEALRAAELLESTGNAGQALPMLERAHRSVSDALADRRLPAEIAAELREARTALADRLGRATAGGPLVTLGGSLGRRR